MKDLQITKINENFEMILQKGILEKVNKSLVKVEKSFNIYNRSKSEFCWKRFILKESTPLRNIRQISAEISRKREALFEVKYKMLKKIAEIKIEEEKITEEQTEAEKELINIKIMELKEQLVLLKKPITGCAKDIILLSNIYEDLEKGIIAKYGKFDEEIFEIEESKYWIKRVFAQCLRDIRQYGKITKGEQESLELLGFSPTVVGKMLNAFHMEELKSTDVSGKNLKEFLNELSEKYYNYLNKDCLQDYISDKTQSECLCINEKEMIEE